MQPQGKNQTIPQPVQQAQPINPDKKAQSVRMTFGVVLLVGAGLLGAPILLANAMMVGSSSGGIFEKDTVTLLVTTIMPLVMVATTGLLLVKSSTNTKQTAPKLHAFLRVSYILCPLIVLVSVYSFIDFWRDTNARNQQIEQGNCLKDDGVKRSYVQDNLLYECDGKGNPPTTKPYER